MPINALKKVINVAVQITPDTSKNTIILKEDCRGTRFPGVEVHNLPEGIVVFKLDINKKGYSKKSMYLSTVENLHKACDYVIICQLPEGGHIVFCELKSKNKKGAKLQLICTIPFINYLSSILEIHNDIDITSFERHYIIFHLNSRLNKTKPKNKEFRKEEYRGHTIKMAGNPQRISINKLLQ